MQLYNIHHGIVQRSAAPARFKPQRPRRSEVELRAHARTSSLADKSELVASFVGQDVFVRRGMGKGRIGRAVGVGLDKATVVFDGSQDQYKVGVKDAVNV